MHPSDIIIIHHLSCDKISEDIWPGWFVTCADCMFSVPLLPDEITHLDSDISLLRGSLWSTKRFSCWSLVMLPRQILKGFMTSTISAQDSLCWPPKAFDDSFPFHLWLICSSGLQVQFAQSETSFEKELNVSFACLVVILMLGCHDDSTWSSILFASLLIICPWICYLMLLETHSCARLLVLTLQPRTVRRPDDKEVWESVGRQSGVWLMMIGVNTVARQLAHLLVSCCCSLLGEVRSLGFPPPVRQHGSMHMKNSTWPSDVHLTSLKAQSVALST